MIATQLFHWTPMAGLLAVAFAFMKSRQIGAAEEGTDRMKEIAGYIREGAMAFLNREYRLLAVFVAIVAALLGVYSTVGGQGHWMIAITFICGAFASALAGYFGMKVATNANVRTTHAARTGLAKALGIAFSGGTVMGMYVVGLGVLGIAGLVTIFKSTGFVGESWAEILDVVTGFSLGASSIALFARVGGGIFTKAADVGADLVGKVEAGIPEDDPRNPAVIADNVGDNVGDVAGMGADLFESYVGSIISAMVLASAVDNGIHTNAVVFPVIVAACGIVVSMLGTLLVYTTENGNPQTALHRGTFAAAGLMILTTMGLAYLMFPEGFGGFAWWGIVIAVVAGVLGGTTIGILTEAYTGEDKEPVHQIAKDSQTGSATTIISGLAVGMQSTTWPILVIAASVLISYEFAGLYGVAMAALGMLSTTGIQLAVDAYGPIADNAGGIAEMAGLESSVREKTDKLDAVGNTTAAIGKGFAIGSAAMTALALFSAFAAKANLTQINVAEPMVLCGVLVGAMLPFLFSAMAMTAVGRAAFDMINEVRRQFKEIPGLMEGTATADYRRCVDIATQAAIQRMVAPGLLAVLVPVAVGFLFGAEALAGVLVGVTVSGVLMAIFQSNAGGAWDNAKKHIEGGHFGGKGSDAHKAAVVGDTVGDPFKDTSGPALNILVKLMSVVALVIAPFLAL